MYVEQENDEEGASMSERERRKQTANILMNKTADARILSFRTKAPAADEAHVNSLKVPFFALQTLPTLPIDFLGQRPFQLSMLYF